MRSGFVSLAIVGCVDGIFNGVVPIQVFIASAIHGGSADEKTPRRPPLRKAGRGHSPLRRVRTRVVINETPLRVPVLNFASHALRIIEFAHLADHCAVLVRGQPAFVVGNVEGVGSEALPRSLWFLMRDHSQRPCTRSAAVAQVEAPASKV